MTVVMDRGVAEDIRRHGEEEYPHECCGFLFGTLADGTQRIVEARRQSNARTESREVRFLISPEDFREAEKHARQSGRQMLGIYHSHPDDVARPSGYDRDHAWPWYSYLILSVARGAAGDLNAWQLRDDRSGFDPVDLGEREA
jgi:proteasome lid subunit RPN8/RPN11